MKILKIQAQAEKCEVKVTKVWHVCMKLGTYDLYNPQ